MEKKWKIIIYAVVFIFLLGSLLYYPLKPEKPPVPRIAVNGQSIQTGEVEHVWKRFLSTNAGSCKNNYGPLFVANNIVSTKVKPGDRIDIVFDYQPKKLRVKLWNNSKDIQEIKLENSSITAPMQRGIYIYEVLGRWRQGEVSTAFKIEVQ